MKTMKRGSGMRIRWVIAALAMASAGTGAVAQNSAALRAQMEETMALIRQAESMGVDVSEMRAMMEELRRQIEEDERAEREIASRPVEQPMAEPAAALEPNLAAGVCGDFGITEENYRTAALSGGNDVQMKTLCGQAMEYYSMYKRAMAQKHPEAWRTYDAHKQASMQLGAFDRDTRAKPGEGIQVDTKTAVQVAAENRAAQAAADAQAASIPRPPQAPPCKGCVSPQ
jgi:hypothetical protein